MTDNFSRLQNFIVLRKLHYGTHSKVKLIKNESLDLHYVAHIFKHSVFSSFFNAEVQNLQSLASNHCVALVESSPDGLYVKKTGDEYRCMYFVIEFMRLGCVADIANSSDPLSDPSLRYLCKAMLTSLQNLHNSNFCLRTISPQNIFFDENLRVKFSGLAYAEQISSNPHSMITAKKFMAPEIVNQEKLYNGEYSDVFSLGVVIFYMKILRAPFLSVSKADTHQQLFAKDKNKYWKSFSRTTVIDSVFCDFIEKFLDFIPENRVTVAEALSHPWLEGDTGTFESVKEELDNRKNEMLRRGNLSNVSSRLVGLSPINYRAGGNESQSSSSLEFMKVKPVFNIFLSKSNIIYTTIPPKDLMVKVNQYFLENSISIEISGEFTQLKGLSTIYQEQLEFKCVVYQIDESSAVEVHMLKGNYFDFSYLVRHLKNSIIPPI